MRNFPQIDTTTLPRISQIDCLPQNRVDPATFEVGEGKARTKEWRKTRFSSAAHLLAVLLQRLNF